MTDPQHSTEPTSLVRLIRNRIIAGVFVLLPIYITYAVLHWLYDTLYTIALKPISAWLRYAWNFDENDTSWALTISLSAAALFLVCAVLYVAGMFFRSRLHQLVNWILLNVPGVSTIYSAVIKVFDALSNSAPDKRRFKRVVLVQFPHAGMKAPAFVTNECIEETTGKTILCVYVPTTPVPTSGYMLMVPEEEVVDLNWDLEETLQAIVSGGIAVPDRVTYFAEPMRLMGESEVSGTSDKPNA